MGRAERREEPGEITCFVTKLTATFDGMMQILWVTKNKCNLNDLNYGGYTFVSGHCKYKTIKLNRNKNETEFDTYLNCS
jgi:hypothetical protein